MRSTDTPEERRRKAVVFTINSIAICIAVVIQATPSRLSLARLAEFIAYMTCNAAGAALMAWLLLTRSLPLHVLGAWILCASVAVLIFDLDTTGQSQFRTWNWVILLMDLCLSFRVPRVYQHTVLALTIMYLFVRLVDSGADLGIEDAILADSSQHAEICDCPDPPCAPPTAHAAVSWVCVIVVLIGDYIVTRTFADAHRSEQARTIASVRLSERVTQLLADYATADARKVVAEEGAALPDALLDSYRRLLNNLDRYRAFLPDSLLFNEPGTPDENGGMHFHAPPASPFSAVSAHTSEVRDVAVSFTDIQSSTELWESHPQAMHEALRIHNRVMRCTYGACGGYEVKTIGDSFMVAFDTVLDAVRFGLEAQLGLLRQLWPKGLLAHPLCRPTASSAGGLLWNGLRVRIAMHYGPARVDPNPVTGRSDFFGHTVNTAGRMERVVHPGGLVAVTGSVMSELGEPGLKELRSPATLELGARELKGIKEAVEVWALAPQELQERLSLLRDIGRRGSTGESIGGIVAVCLPEVPSVGDSRSCSSGLPSPLCSPRLARGLDDVVVASLRPMHRTVATCATVRIALCASELLPVSISSFAGAAALAADQTQGVVETVLSACVVISWNASLPCADHTAGCRGFLATMRHAETHLGAASGAVLSGNVAAGRRCFATIVGGCVELAAALAEEAERCGDDALVAGAVADDLVWTGAAYSAQVWNAPGHAAVVVSAVDTAHMGGKWHLRHDVDDTQGGMHAELLAALFHRACAGEPGSAVQLAVLAELEALDSSSDARERLIDRIKGGWVRCRPIPPLWDVDVVRPPHHPNAVAPFPASPRSTSR